MTVYVRPEHRELVDEAARLELEPYYGVEVVHLLDALDRQEEHDRWVRDGSAPNLPEGPSYRAVCGVTPHPRDTEGPLPLCARCRRRLPAIRALGSTSEGRRQAIALNAVAAVERNLRRHGGDPDQLTIHHDETGRHLSELELALTEGAP